MAIRSFSSQNNGRQARLKSVINPYNSSHPSSSSRRLFVGNLSFETAWSNLKDHFRQLGGSVVRADVIHEAATGRSKGCGIVEMATAEQALDCIQRLNDTELMGRLIFVREDREQDTIVRPAGGGRGPPTGGVAGNRPAQQISATGCRIFLGNLSWEVKWQELKDFCKQVGTVVRADVLLGPDGRSKGAGIVEFATVHEAQRAINELNDTDLCGRICFIREGMCPPLLIPHHP